MSTVPRLTIGLPVYNGERYLAESLDSLLAQTFEDYELIISDNASTDGTADICRRYEKQDSRVRYVRQLRNIGSSPNHNFVATEGRGQLFKWASHDDVYAPELLSRCVEALDEYPQVVLAHAWTAQIDNSGSVTKAFEYPLATGSERAPERFRSMLFGQGGDDYYGVIRARTVRAIAPQDSYHHSDRTIVAEMSLYGPFYQVPDWLYFRRVPPVQVETGWPEQRWPSARAAARTWTRAGLTACATLASAYTESTSGRTSRLCSAPLCLLQTAGIVTGIWPIGSSADQTRRRSRQEQGPVSAVDMASVDRLLAENEVKAS